MSTAALGELHHRHTPGTARAALAYPRFRILFVGSVLSNAGTWMQNFILPAYLDERTGSAGLVGLLVFAQLGPLLLLSIPAGVLADRIDRTRFVVAMQVTMLVGSIALAALVANHAALWTLFAAQLAIGVANALNAPAFSASLPMLVDHFGQRGKADIRMRCERGVHRAQEVPAVEGVVLPGVLAIERDQQHAARLARGARGKPGQFLREVRRRVVAMPARITEADQVGHAVMAEIAFQVTARLREAAARVAEFRSRQQELDPELVEEASAD